MENETTATPTTPETPTPPQETPPVQTPNSGNTGATEESIPLSKLNERLAQKERSVLKALGDFADIKTAKALIEEAKQLKDAQLTEKERSEKALKEAQDKAAQAEARIVELETQTKRKALGDLIAQLAQAENAVDAQDVVNALLADTDEKWIENPKNAEKAIKGRIEDLRKSKPHWFKHGGQGSPSNRGGNPLQRKPETDTPNRERLWKL